MSIKFNLFINYCLLSIIHCFSYEIINETNYEKLEYNEINAVFIIKKNKSNLNIPNDGFIFSFNKIFKNKPKHLSFLYSIPNFQNYYGEYLVFSYYEGCDIRLTTSSKKDIINNNFKTKDNSDVVFFRIRLPNKMNFNVLPVYLPFIKNNYFMNGEYFKVDIILNWKKGKGVLLFNDSYVWNVANDQGKKDKHNVKTKTNFYHNSIKNDDFHIILYNFKANSTCYIKNLQLCEDFCDSKVEEVYKKYLNIYYLKYNILGMLISIFVIM